MLTMILLTSRRVCGLATGKARLPTVDSLLIGTTRRSVPTERSDRQLGRSVTRYTTVAFYQHLRNK